LGGTGSRASPLLLKIEKMRLEKTPKFTFFKAPVTNVSPDRQITIRDAYLAISGDYFKKSTLQLRSIEDQHENRNFKATTFHFVTFSGTFKQRNEQGLITPSGYLVLDFDKLSDVQKVKNRLLKDPCFETELLFVSPNGNGLKWVIKIDVSGKYSHGQYFDADKNYVKSTHQLEVDKSGRDVCRLCFLSWDPDAFVHPKHLIR
jgi:hypothetical protein